MSTLKRNNIQLIYILYTSSRHILTYLSEIKVILQNYGFNVINEESVSTDLSDLSSFSKKIYEYITYYDNIIIFSLLESYQFISFLNSLSKNSITDFCIYHFSPISYSRLYDIDLNGNDVYILDSYAALYKITEDSLLAQIIPNIDQINGYTGTLSLALMYFFTSYDKARPKNVTVWINAIKSLQVESYLGKTKINEYNCLDQVIHMSKLIYDKSLGKNNIIPYYNSITPFFTATHGLIIDNECYFKDIAPRICKIAIVTKITSNTTHIFYSLMVTIGSILEYNLNSDTILILFQIYNTFDDNNLSKNIIEELGNNREIRQIILLADIRYWYENYNYLRDDQFLWYAFHSDGEHCIKNIFSTGALPNQKLSFLISQILYLQYDTVWLCYSDMFLYNTLKDVFLELSTGKLTVNLQILPKSYAEYDIFLRKVNEKTPIVILLPFNEANSFYKNLFINGISFDKIPVFSVIQDYIEDNEDLEGLYYVSHYIGDISYSEFNVITTKYINIDKADTRMFLSFLASNLLIKSLTQFDNNDYSVDDFIEASHSVEIYGYKLQSNNHIKHYYYLMKYSNNNSVPVFDGINLLIDPESFILKNRYSNNKKYTCNITNSSIISEVHSYTIVAFISLSGKTSYIDYGVYESLNLAIKEVNDENVLPFTLNLLVENMKCNEESVGELAEKYMKNSSVISFVYSGTKIGRNILKPLIKRNNKLLFYINSYEGEECEKNIIYLDYTPYHFIKIYASYFSTIYSNSTYLILISKEDYSTNIMIKSLEERKLKVVVLDGTNTDIKSLINNIINIYINDFIIITDFYGYNLSLLSTTLSQYKLDSSIDIRYQIFLRSAIFQQFSKYNITDVNLLSIVDRESTDYIEFTTSLLSFLTETSYVSNRMLSAYYSIHLLSLSLQSIKDGNYSTDNIRINLYNKQYKSFTIKTNNHVKLNLYLVHITKFPNFYQIAYKDLNPNPFNKYGIYDEMENHYCDWNENQENGDKLTIEPVFYLLVLTSFENELFRSVYEVLDKFRYTERKSASQVRFSLQYILLEIGVNPISIKQTINNYLSSIDVSDLFGIFGGTSSEMRDAIIEGIGDKKVIYFYPSYSEGGYCYENVITTGPSLSLFEEELHIRLFSYTGNIIIFYDNYVFSTKLYEEFYLISEINKYNIIFVRRYTQEMDIYQQTKIDYDSYKNECYETECIVIDLSKYIYSITSFFYDEGLLNSVSQFSIYSIFSYKNEDFSEFVGLSRVYFLSTLYCIEDNSQSYRVTVAQNLKNYFPNNTPCDSIIEGVISTLDLIYSTLSRSSVYDYTNVLTMLHDKTYSSPSGDSMLLDNNIVSKTVYILELKENNEYNVIQSSIKPLKPIYSPEYDVNELCIWDNIVKSLPILINNYVNILIIYKNIKSSLYSARTHLYVTTSIIDMINSYSQFNNSMLLTHTYIYDNINDTYLINYMSQTELSFIVGCIYPECGKEISELSLKNDKIFFYCGINDGINSYTNTINTASTFRQQLVIALNYFQNSEFKNIILFIPDTEYGNNVMKEFYATPELQNYNIIKVFLISSFNNDIINEVNQTITTSNLLIFNILYGDLLIESITNFGYIITQNIHVLFNYNEYLFNTDELKILSGSYVLSSFVEDSENLRTLGFISMLSEKISTAITPYMENNNIAIQLLFNNYIDCLQITNVISTSFFLANIYLQNIQSLIHDINIYYDHNSNIKVYIFELQESTNLVHLYPKIIESVDISPSITGTNYFGPSTVIKANQKTIVTIDIIFLSVVFICTTLAIVFVTKFKEYPVIKRANYVYLVLYFFNFYLFEIVSLLCIIKPRNDSICSARIWILCLAMINLLLLLFIKTIRFQKVVVDSNQKVYLNNNTIYKNLFYCVIIQLLYLLIWQLSKPSKYIFLILLGVKKLF